VFVYRFVEKEEEEEEEEEEACQDMCQHLGGVSRHVSTPGVDTCLDTPSPKR